MELNGRMQSILEEIAASEGEPVSVSRICMVHNIKKRTFYYDLKNINSLLQENGIEEIRLDNGKCLASRISKEKIKGLLTDGSIRYFKSSSERTIIISAYIGLSDERVNLACFEKMLEISKNTILSDLRNIRASIAEYGIRLVSDIREGYSFSGDEASIRRYLYNSFRQSETAKTKDEIRSLVNRLLPLDKQGDDSWTSFRECLAIYEELLGADIADADIEGCVFVMAVSFIRSHMGFRYKEKRTDRAIREMPAFESTRIMMKRIEEYMGLKAYTAEITYIAQFLIATKNFRISESAHDDPRALEFTDKFLRAVKELGNVSFSDEENTRERMANHIMPMIYRIAYGMQIENPLTENVKSSYPEVFELAGRAIESMDPALARKISDDELSYLAIYIASGTGEYREGEKTNKILIVCAEGVAASLMIQSQLEDLLGNYYEYEISSLRRAMYLDLEEYLLIITTIDNEFMRSRALKVKVLLSNDNKNDILDRLSKAEMSASFSLYEVMRIIEVYTGINEPGLKGLNMELLRYLNAHRSGDDKTLGGTNPEVTDMKLVKGLGISTGREMGTVHRITNVDFKLENIRIALKDAESEIEKLSGAFAAACEQLEKIIEKSDSDETRDIMAVHIEIAKDKALRNKAEMLIREERYSANDALYTACEEFATMLEDLNDEYMSQRAADIRDVCKRVYRAMIGIPDEQLESPSIVVADDLTPSVLSSLERKYVMAFVSGTGGKTSHIAIMANGMGIPAIAGLGEEIGCIHAGDTVIVNGKNGYVYVDPDEATKEKFAEAKAQDIREEEERRKFIDKPAETKDGGRRVEVCANIAFVNECENATAVGAEGVGLYRTEFLYMDSDTWPEEDAQFESYKMALEAMAPRPVIVRTMDIGGDKALPYMDIEKEDNPFLGFRALRISLANPDMFKTQLRALLRASVFGKLRIMFPMVSNLKEFRQAKAYVEECKRELEAEGIAFDKDVETGIMVEIPAAAIMAEKLAEEVDFFSIGTNDLIQYTMAADRMNNKVAYLYDSLQPAVLHLIKNVIDAAHKHGKMAGMCGEMAGAEISTKLLVGMGLDEFSMSSGSILRFKSNINKFTYEEAKEFASRCLECVTADEVHELVNEKGGMANEKNADE